MTLRHVAGRGVDAARLGPESRAAPLTPGVQGPEGAPAPARRRGQTGELRSASVSHGCKIFSLQTMLEMMVPPSCTAQETQV